MEQGQFRLTLELEESPGCGYERDWLLDVLEVLSECLNVSAIGCVADPSQS